MESDLLLSTVSVGDLKEFKEEGSDATISKLNDNLIGMNAVKLLNKEQFKKDYDIVP